MDRRVAVTGIGVISPLGVGASEHWAGLLAGRSGVSRVDRLARLGYPVDVAAEVPAPALAGCLPRLPRKQLKLYNRATTFAMAAASMAAEDAGINAPVSDATRAGVNMATLFIPYPIQSLLQLLPDLEALGNRGQLDIGKALKQCMGGVNPLDLSLKIVPNLTAGHIAIRFGLRGACRTVADGWTGGMHAIGQAVSAIRDGSLDLVFTGGAECPLEDLVFADLCATDLLAPSAAVPERTCRPFGSGRQGTVAGEGAAILVLEAYEHAVDRGARVRAVVAGFGAASGGLAPAGLRDSVCRAMRAALADSRRREVDAASLHGDGSRLNDLGEALALRAMAEAWGEFPSVYATKGAHGNLFSAAGPLEVAGAVMALESQTLPPSRNCDEGDPACGLALAADGPRSLAGAQSVLVNAVGAFGETASLVVAREF
jgi:3-oxoacyl-[acyl-carrier-protein] synthase II